MDELLVIVEVADSFRKKIERRLRKHGRKTRAAKEMGITRMALWQFLEKGTVRRSTLEIIVRKFIGENFNIEDYIKKL